MGRTHALAAALVLALLPEAAEAQRARAPQGVRRELASPHARQSQRDWSVDLHIGTLAPLHMGGGLRITLGQHFIVGGSVGITPRFYAEAMQWMVDQTRGGMHGEVAHVMSGALLARTEMGVVFAPDFGFEITVNYTYLRASRPIDPALVQAYMGEVILDVDLSHAELNMTLHGIGGELGCSFEPGANSFGRIALGVTYFVAAETDISLPSSALLQSLANAGARRIESAITRNAVVPSLALTLGWRLR